MLKTIPQKIHDLISLIHPIDELEERHIDQTLEWIQSGAEIFRIAKPATPDPHLVCYFVIFDVETNQILLTQHKKSGLLLPPGGHMEPNEDPLETVRREAKEELDMKPDFLLQNPFFLTVSKTVGAQQEHTDISLWYLLQGKSKTMYNYCTAEFEKIEWFHVDKVPLHLCERNMSRFLQKLERLRIAIS